MSALPPPTAATPYILAATVGVVAYGALLALLTYSMTGF